ncbi:MAG: TonB-dependent receptor [Hyphomonadaceae bacterium]
MSHPGPGWGSQPSSIRVLLLASTALVFAGGAFAQTVPSSAPPEESRDVVVVVGSQIVGAQPTEALPVTMLGVEDIAATGATSGDELYRSIPQLGDVSFNSTRTIGSLNDARGDTASINLRSVGAGNTLVLLNGRRMVNHPTAQSDNGVPIMSVNANTIPTMGLSRVEVLLDGASALYGADAVAGVINNVLKTDFEGVTAEVQVGAEEDVSAKEFSAAFEAGFDLHDGAGNLSVFASYYGRDPIFASERDFTADADQSRRVPAEWSSLAASFNNRSITSAWGVFDKFAAGNIVVAGTPVTNAAGQFHIQPNTLPFGATGQPCTATPNSLLPNGLCMDLGSTRDPILRYNINEDLTVQNGVDRYNVFAAFDHNIVQGLEFFGEAGVYLADTLGYRESAPMLGAVPIVVPSTNYYNPFGAVGSPNRLAGYTGPALNLVLGSLTGTQAYRPIDAGPRRTEVENLTTRLLAGLRGDASGWNWESALLYSEATANDTENRISNTLFQQALARSTPDAYNPFNGGCFDDLGASDCTSSAAATIDDITVQVSRKSKTTLAMWDAKVSRPDLFTLWAGDIGIAAGLEIRRETYADDRDPRQDGTLMFDDIINTAPITNDLQGNNPSLDVSGARNIESAYAELAVPLARDLPLAQSIDLQLAVRYEHSDTFGEVTKPKIALAWRPTDFLLVRSAWSEGFKAPNLQQQFETEVQRSNINTDYLFCHAFLGPTGFANTCPSVTGASQSVTVVRSGSESLRPEESKNSTIGMVFEPVFLPPEWGRVSLTADWWRIEQSDVINVFGEVNHIALDYALRALDPTNPNAGNPNVVRADASTLTQQEIAAFQARGLAPAGHILRIEDVYYNQNRATAEGLDLGLYYTLDDTAFGDFSFRINGANLYKAFGAISEPGALINGAAAAGTISSGVTVGGAQGQQVRNGGRPKWRYTSTLTWRNGAYGAGWFTSYIGSVFDQGLLRASDRAQFEVEAYQTHNLYAQYEFGYDTDTPLRLRVGVRNVFDETPPLADTQFGFLGELHSPQGRFFYLNVRKAF